MAQLYYKANDGSTWESEQHCIAHNTRIAGDFLINQGDNKGAIERYTAAIDSLPINWEKLPATIKERLVYPMYLNRAKAKINNGNNYEATQDVDAVFIPMNDFRYQQPSLKSEIYYLYGLTESESGKIIENLEKAIEYGRGETPYARKAQERLNIIQSSQLPPNFTGKGKQIDGNATYEGDFVNGKLHGKGKHIDRSGFIYEGDFVNGNPHGKVRTVSPQGIIYEGDFVEGKRNGKGKLTFADGRVYVGDFVDNFFNGKGKMTYPDGRIEEGNWKDQEFIGK